MQTAPLNRDLTPDFEAHAHPPLGMLYNHPSASDAKGRVFEQTVQTIQGDPQALYELWSDVARIPRWQEYVVSVTRNTEKSTHWVLGDRNDPDGKRWEFDSEITEDVPGAKIAWRSLDPEVDLGGDVTFLPAPSGRGTLVTLRLVVKVPMGVFGSALAAMVKRSPRQLAIENLRHFKQLAETGELPTVEGQPHGPRGLKGEIKRWFYGETNPTPPGTSDSEPA